MRKMARPASIASPTMPPTTPPTISGMCVWLDEGGVLSVLLPVDDTKSASLALFYNSSRGTNPMIPRRVEEWWHSQL